MEGQQGDMIANYNVGSWTGGRIIKDIIGTFVKIGVLLLELFCWNIMLDFLNINAGAVS